MRGEEMLEAVCYGSSAVGIGLLFPVFINIKNQHKGEFPCVVIFQSLAFYALVAIENFVKLQFVWNSFAFGCFGWICFAYFMQIYYQKARKSTRRIVEENAKKFLGIFVVLIVVLATIENPNQRDFAVSVFTSAFGIAGNAYPVLYIKPVHSELTVMDFVMAGNGAVCSLLWLALGFVVNDPVLYSASGINSLLTIFWMSILLKKDEKKPKIPIKKVDSAQKGSSAKLKSQ